MWLQYLQISLLPATISYYIDISSGLVTTPCQFPLFRMFSWFSELWTSPFFGLGCENLYEKGIELVNQTKLSHAANIVTKSIVIIA